MLPKDKGMVGAFNDKIEFFPATFTHDRDTLIRVAAGPRLRQSDAPLRRDCRQHGPADKIDGRRVVLVFTDGDDTGSRADSGERARAGAPRRSDDLRGGLRSDYFNGSRQVRSKPDSRAEAAGRRDRRRLLRARQNQPTSRPRSRASRRSCTASTCSALRRRCSTERFIASASSQEARHDRARQAQLPRVGESN